MDRGWDFEEPIAKSGQTGQTLAEIAHPLVLGAPVLLTRARNADLHTPVASLQIVAAQLGPVPFPRQFRYETQPMTLGFFPTYPLDGLRRLRPARTLLILIAVIAPTATLLAQPRPQPAEVPDAVKMERPTAEEVTAVKEALAKFVEDADAKTKAILEKHPELVSVRPPSPFNACIFPNLAPMFRQKHQANLEVAKKGEAELLLMGDSITDFWRNESGPFAGKAVFDKHFGQWKVANFGIAGDTTQGVLYRLKNGEGQGFKPRAVMLMIGTNNTGGNSAAEIAEGIGAVVLELQKDFPEAQILLLAVFPRAKPGDAVRDKIKRINEKIAKLHDGKKVHYLDIGAKFLDSEQRIPADIMSDELHPGAKGYEIWAEAVKGPLTQMMSTEKPGESK